MPYEPPKIERKPGVLRGQIWIADDFNGPLPDDLQRLFEGEDE